MDLNAARYQRRRRQVLDRARTLQRQADRAAKEWHAAQVAEVARVDALCVAIDLEADRRADAAHIARVFAERYGVSD